MKQHCVGCNILTKNTYNIFGDGDPYLVPVCRRCFLRTVTEIKKRKKQEAMKKARILRWKDESSVTDENQP